jgi:hypothetical protein
MKLNPYSILLIGLSTALVLIIKTNKNIKYEKTTNDSCVCLDDSTRFIYSSTHKIFKK